MSTTRKTWIGIVLIIVVAILALFAAHLHSAREQASTGSESSLPTSSTDTSDAALQQDSAAIDTQLSGLASDTATVNEGISESQ